MIPNILGMVVMTQVPRWLILKGWLVQTSMPLLVATLLGRMLFLYVKIYWVTCFSPLHLSLHTISHLDNSCLVIELGISQHIRQYAPIEEDHDI